MPSSPDQQRFQPLDINTLLRRYSLRPRKSLGQNFLVDESALERVVAAAEILPEDLVLEIGAGLGSLTRHLAYHARRVVCVELDSNFIPLMREVLAEFPNVEIVQGNILSLNLAELLRSGVGAETGRYIVAANIPYYITSALIRYLLESDKQPDRLVLTVQREVAERICAEPGSLSLLALSVQVYGKPAITGRIPAGAFFPAPKVDSAIIRVDIYSEPIIPAELLNIFFRLAKAGFSQKRKTLRNALSGGMHWHPTRAEEVLRHASIDPMRRAETLSLQDWRVLSEVVSLLRPEQQNQTR